MRRALAQGPTATVECQAVGGLPIRKSRGRYWLFHRKTTAFALRMSATRTVRGAASTG